MFKQFKSYSISRVFGIIWRIVIYSVSPFSASAFASQWIDFLFLGCGDLFFFFFETLSPSSDNDQQLQAPSEFGTIGTSPRAIMTVTLLNHHFWPVWLLSRQKRREVTWRRWSWTTRESSSTCSRLTWLSTSWCPTPGTWWACADRGEESQCFVPKVGVTL